MQRQQELLCGTEKAEKGKPYISLFSDASGNFSVDV